MRKHAHSPSLALPIMMTRLTFAAWETIFRRSVMMAQGTCSPNEYWRMAEEKADAMQQSAMAVMSGRGHTAALAPFVTKARANAKRLRGRG